MLAVAEQRLGESAGRRRRDRAGHRAGPDLARALPDEGEHRLRREELGQAADRLPRARGPGPAASRPATTCVARKRSTSSASPTPAAPCSSRCSRGRMLRSMPRSSSRVARARRTSTRRRRRCWPRGPARRTIRGCSRRSSSSSSRRDTRISRSRVSTPRSRPAARARASCCCAPRCSRPPETWNAPRRTCCGPSRRRRCCPAPSSCSSRSTSARDRLAEARRSFEEAETAGVLHSGARLLLGRLYLSQGELAKAQQAFEKVVADQPELASARNDLAFVLAERGEQLDRALELARGAQQALGDNPAAIDTLGYVYYRGRSPRGGARGAATRDRARRSATRPAVARLCLPSRPGAAGAGPQGRGRGRVPAGARRRRGLPGGRGCAATPRIGARAHSGRRERVVAARRPRARRARTARATRSDAADPHERLARQRATVCSARAPPPRSRSTRSCWCAATACRAARTCRRTCG